MSKDIKKDLDDLLDGRRKFEIEFESGEVKEYYIGMPTAEDVRQADWEHAKEYNRAIREGIFTAAEMQDALTERGLIGPEYEEAGKELRVKMAEKLILMERETDKDKRVELAVEVANLREDIFRWNQRLTGPMACTCEQRADDTRTEYLTSAIVQDKAGNRVWETYKDFRAESDLAIQTKARFEVMMWMQGLESDFLDKTPENEILKQLLEETAQEAVERLPKELPEPADVESAPEKEAKTKGRRKKSSKPKSTEATE